ncbi:hypothetical protein L1785_03280 [Antribacter sp. KLBMP9083]|uniref:Polysaccharide chain length determinant N-terminal domain-containing protein n=1 Tax=Antribacter soli TaxID=2910976 RepID=A0AA41QBA9_9MICO|nr:hypothetical protein [Antribacter soli]MCF4119992.1 hypothetical protein [Antribacter soli]
MTFSEIVRALGRRWYVVLLGLLLTGWLGYGAWVLTPPVYTARGLLLLLPSDQAVGEGGNPFLVLGGLDLPARILVAYYESDVAKDQVAEVAPDAEYVVAIEESTRGPVIAVDVKEKTPEAAVAALGYIADSIPRELGRLQQEVDAPPESVVQSMQLTMDEEATTDNSGTVRALIAAVGAGLVTTGLMALGADGLALRRRDTVRQKSSGADGAAARATAAGGPVQVVQVPGAASRRPADAPVPLHPVASPPDGRPQPVPSQPSQPAPRNVAPQPAPSQVAPPQAAPASPATPPHATPQQAAPPTPLRTVPGQQPSARPVAIPPTAPPRRPDAEERPDAAENPRWHVVGRGGEQQPQVTDAETG